LNRRHQDFQSKQDFISREGRTVRAPTIKSYGMYAFGGGFRVIVDASKAVDEVLHETYYLMVLLRAVDPTIDVNDDTVVDKSRPFLIPEGEVRMVKS